MKHILFFTLWALFLNLIFVSKSDAQAIIRDTEIEQVIRDWSRPLIEAANLSPESVQFILVQDNRINAFVAGGQNIFLYTGLIQKADTPEQLLGVIAHELGHISAGHLVRLRDASEIASYESILGLVLGVGAAAITGSGEAAAAIGLGAQSLATNRLLGFSRVQESSADQAGLSFMKHAEVDTKGLVDFFDHLLEEERGSAFGQSEYQRTHPLTRDRISLLSNRAEKSQNYGKGSSEQDQEKLEFIQAKLLGYVTPEQVDLIYGETDRSEKAQYARCIAAYRLSKTKKAINCIKDLIKRSPENPYFYELAGDIYNFFGKHIEAIRAYQRSLQIKMDSPLIQIALAEAHINRGKDNDFPRAIAALESAAIYEPRSIKLFKLLATAYGREGKIGLAQLSQAETYLLRSEYEVARKFAEQALESIPPNHPKHLRVKDILNYVDQRG